jgi:hypothetical protein
MTDTLKKLVVDVAKGTQEYIDLTPEEIAQRETDAAAFAVAEAERIAAEEASAEAKASGIAKLLALGLTEEEAQELTK